MQFTNVPKGWSIVPQEHDRFTLHRGDKTIDTDLTAEQVQSRIDNRGGGRVKTGLSRSFTITGLTPEEYQFLENLGKERSTFVRESLKKAIELTEVTEESPTPIASTNP